MEEKRALVKFFNAKASQKYGEPNFSCIYDLKEGLRFVAQHFNQHKTFTKAVKEMVHSLSEQTQSVPSSCGTIINEYMKLL